MKPLAKFIKEVKEDKKKDKKTGKKKTVIKKEEE